MIDIPFRRILLMLDYAWISEDYAVTGHVAVHIAVRGNQHVVANGDTPYNRGVHTNPNTVANGRHAFPCATVFLPDSDSFMYVAVLANGCVSIDCDTAHMPQIESRSDVALAVNINVVLVFQLLDTPAIVIQQKPPQWFGIYGSTLAVYACTRL